MYYQHCLTLIQVLYSILNLLSSSSANGKRQMVMESYIMYSINGLKKESICTSTTYYTVECYLIVNANMSGVVSLPRCWNVVFVSLFLFCFPPCILCSIDCYTCSSKNGSLPACDDPMSPAQMKLQRRYVQYLYVRR